MGLRNSHGRDKNSPRFRVSFPILILLSLSPQQMWIIHLAFIRLPKCYENSRFCCGFNVLCHKHLTVYGVTRWTLYTAISTSSINASFSIDYFFSIEILVIFFIVMWYIIEITAIIFLKWINKLNSCKKTISTIIYIAKPFKNTAPWTAKDWNRKNKSICPGLLLHIPPSYY